MPFFFTKEWGDTIYELGRAMVESDKKDMTFSSKDHPSPLHHWYLGFAVMMAARVAEIARKKAEEFKTYGGVRKSI